MKKLIELLNEWQEKELGKGGAKYLMFDGINKVFRLNNGCSLCQELVLSHRFGFIKWLVDNEKIEYKNLNKIHTRKGLNVLIEQELYEDLIMLLSIQDEPIDLLCNIIK